LSSEFSYLVAGGTGGLGRAIIRLLAQLGAKHIVTMSRSGSDNEKVKALQEELIGDGVDLLVYKGSVLETKDVEAIKDLTKNHPIRGIVQGAMVLQVRLSTPNVLI
jgi:NAD(P)-dependent dehydrogenase (short-subunit alcohol dehydrogenase family)